MPIVMASTLPNASIQGGGKSIATSSVHSPSQNQNQGSSTSPAFDAGNRRSNSCNNNAFARNNHTVKKQPRNSKKPRLADEDAMAESGAMRNPSGRRGQTSITHLMNFSLPPRPTYNSSTQSRGTRRNPTYGLGSGHHASDKARYIHANYRFIVNPSGQYHGNAIDADLHLEWPNVLQILASAESQSSSCPICLSHPVAPRMAKCGHIFCLPCLIRYMHSTDETDLAMVKRARYKKCPICWDSIYISETKPVRWFTGQEGPAPREGEDVVLRLVMRQPGSTLALPRDGADALEKGEDIPWYHAAEVSDYARVMKGSEDYMTAQFDAEIEQLVQQEREDELMFGEETEWSKKAVRSVQEAKEKVMGIGNAPNASQKPVERKPKRDPIQFNESDAGVPDMYLVQHAIKSGKSNSETQPAFTTPNALTSPETSSYESNQPQPRHNVNSSDRHSPDSPYFFYQALLHYYLAPLDIRILKAAFGSFASFPSTLLPRVERVSTGHVIDDELRKRTKYLSHLPYGCEVGFLECNWTDVVVPEVLANFTEDIEKRRKKNREKENREEKDRQRAERLEDKEQWAAARRKRSSIPEENFADEDFAPLGLGAGSLGTDGSSPPWSQRHGASFGALASPGTSPNAPRTVWGTSIVAPTTPELAAMQYAENDGDDGWLQDWEKELMQENEIIAQVKNMSLDNGEGSSSSAAAVIAAGGGSGGGGGGGGKKKKAKKITLMSTTARRAA